MESLKISLDQHALHARQVLSVPNELYEYMQGSTMAFGHLLKAVKKEKHVGLRIEKTDSAHLYFFDSFAIGRASYELGQRFLKLNVELINAFQQISKR